MRSLKNCIDCGEVLCKDSRSRQQPKIRCQACFDKFSPRVEAVLEDMIDTARQAKGEKEGKG